MSTPAQELPPPPPPYEDDVPPAHEAYPDSLNPQSVASPPSQVRSSKTEPVSDSAQTAQPSTQAEPVREVALPSPSPGAVADQGKITVTGRSMANYSVFDASAATKTDTPIMETAQSIQVVPRAVLSDQMVVDVAEVLENVSSVQSAGNNHTGLVTNFVARGFRLNPLSNFYKNGRPYVFSVTPPTEAIERLEFVKGPASVLYGQAEPGGIVNLSLKRPTRKFFVEPRVQYGRFRHLKAIVDTGGPIGKYFGYRFNGSYTNAKSFRSLQHVKQFVGAAAFQVRLAPKWKLALDLSYQNRRQNADSGLSAGPPKAGEIYGSRVVDVPISRSLNEPWAQVVVSGVELGYELDGKIGNILHLTHSSSAQRQWNDETRADPMPILAASAVSGFKAGDMGRNLRVRDTQRLSLYSDLLARADFYTGPVRHRVLGGVEYFQTVRGVTEFLPILTRAQDFNVFNPVYTKHAPRSLGLDPVRLGRSTLRQFGVFAQEQMTVFEKAHLLLSFRYDRFLDTLDASRIDTASSAIIDQNSGSPTVRAGLLVQPVEPLSLFASYSQGFRPNLDPFANEQFDPQESQQVEGGAKLSLFGGHIMGTVTGYYLTKQNVMIVNAVSQVINLAGQRDASGAEFDLVGELIPGLNLLAGYSFLRAKIAKGDPRPLGTPGVGMTDITGNTPPASPSHSGRVWGTYRIGAGPAWLRGFRVGAGMQARSEVQGDLHNTLQHPGYLRWDAMVGWRKQIGALLWDAQVNFKNLTDRRYFNSTVRNFIKPGDPFTIMAQLGARFGRKSR